MLEIGSDRILFSSDRPFENVDHAPRCEVGRTDAKALFKSNLG